MRAAALIAQFDGLIDLVVQQLVREVEQGAEIEAPTGSRLPVGARINTLGRNQLHANDTNKIHSPVDSRPEW